MGDPFKCWNKPFPCQERCKLLRILQLLHITLSIKLLDEIIQINGASHPQKLTRPFGGTIHVLQPHTSETNTTCGSFASKFEESSSGDNVGGVGGHTTRNSVICNHPIYNWDASACRMQLFMQL
jgi:hypothetical protein